jgi:hypothetical protein
MNPIADDCFVVYVRDRKTNPDSVEHTLVSCGSYQEADTVRRENQGPDRHCIIRFTGPAGGGD